MGFRRPRLTFIATLTALLAGLWLPVTTANADLFKAVRQDDLVAVERILAQGVATNVLNASLFHAESGEMTRALLAGGADPDVPIRDGRNAMHWAVHGKKIGVIGALIEAGADVDATMTSPGTISNGRETALHLLLWSSPRSTLEIAQMLIEAGADPNSLSAHGHTPLHAAATISRDPSVIDLLLDAGSDPLARQAYSNRGNTGKTPLGLARKYNPRLLRTDAGRRLEEATRRAGMDTAGCDGVVVQPSDTKLSYVAERTLGKASRWREIVELNGLEDKGYRAGDCLALP